MRTVKLTRMSQTAVLVLQDHDQARPGMSSLQLTAFRPKVIAQKVKQRVCEQADKLLQQLMAQIIEEHGRRTLSYRHAVSTMHGQLHLLIVDHAVETPTQAYSVVSELTAAACRLPSTGHQYSQPQTKSTLRFHALPLAVDCRCGADLLPLPLAKKSKAAQQTATPETLAEVAEDEALVTCSTRLQLSPEQEHKSQVQISSCSQAPSPSSVQYGEAPDLYLPRQCMCSNLAVLQAPTFAF